MRPHRDILWDKQIRPLLIAYQKKVQGEFPPESAFVISLPNIYPTAGSTPDAVNLTGVWNPATSVADYSWSLSTDPNLLRYDVRQSPGTSYDADASSTVTTIPPDAAPAYSSAVGLPSSGISVSTKIFVVLTTGNERGSNSISITRP